MTGELSHLNPLTQGEKQRERIVTFICDYLREKGYPPSVREVGDAVGLKSPATVHRHLSVLADEGRIVRDESKPRAIRIVPEDAA